MLNVTVQSTTFLRYRPRAALFAFLIICSMLNRLIGIAVSSYCKLSSSVDSRSDAKTSRLKIVNESITIFFSFTLTVLFRRVKFPTLPLTRNLSIKLLPSSSFWRAVPTEMQSSGLTLSFSFCDMRPVEYDSILVLSSDSSKSAVFSNEHNSLVNAAIFF